MKNTLQEIFSKIGNHTGIDYGANDKNSTHSYLSTYDKVLDPYRNGCTFMEIGLATGDSIELFDQYLENSVIFGIDISIVFEPKHYKNDVLIIETDATKAKVLEYFGEDVKFDVIIDDGSHQTQDQIDTFNLLKGKMKKGGIYIIEDLLALDIERNNYLALSKNVEIVDLRHVKGRFDDALVIIRF